MGTPVTPNNLGSTKKKGKYYNPKLYHAASVDTDIASGKRVNYRIQGGKRTGSDPWFLSPYNKQSSLSTDGRAIGEDKYGTVTHQGGILYLTIPNHGSVGGEIIDFTITSGPDAGKSAHRTVYSGGGYPQTDVIAVIIGSALGGDSNFGQITSWSWAGSDGPTSYNCKVTF